MYRVFHRTSKTKMLVVFILLGTLILIQPVLGQAPREFDLLVGKWEGQGKLFGVEASFNMTWTWVLSRQFLRLSFQNSFPGRDGQERVLRARGFYRYKEDGSVDGTWLDSRGELLPLRGNVQKGRLDIKWGTPKTEVGRTVYRILDNDHVQVLDYVLKDGEWEQFGLAHYKRIRTEKDTFPEAVPE